MPFGAKLKELRGDRSQEEMSNAIGITKSSWAMYERNERVPRDEVKVKIAKYFGKTVQEIFLAAASTNSALRRGGVTTDKSIWRRLALMV